VLNRTEEGHFEAARTHQRFYVAFQLRDLCNEMPIHAIAREYEIPRGTVHNLAQSCHGFAAGIVKFCERLEWSVLAAALDHMSDRLNAGMVAGYFGVSAGVNMAPGARSDLLSLAQVTFIKSRTARIFWDNGYKSVGRRSGSERRRLNPHSFISDCFPVLSK
jgi:replicative superfamily II helicase